MILKGNIAPEGCVLKIAGEARTRHRGPARVFEREEDAMAAVTGGLINPGDVMVIRYEGPRGGPGMREMLGVTGAVKLVNEFYKVARDVAFKHDALLDIPRLPADGKDVPVGELSPTTGAGNEAMAAALRDAPALLPIAALIGAPR